MAQIGKRNLLTVLKEASPGFYLDAGEHGELLLPGPYIPDGAKVGDALDVFVYRDSEDRLVATTETPHVMVGEFAYLRVVSINPNVGVFLDWGLAKDLLLPICEQKDRLAYGDWVIVYVYIDVKTDRIVATTRINRHLNLVPPTYVEGQPVNLLITGPTPLGYNAVVENAHRGLLYHNDLSAPLATGERIDGFVREVREDGKIDLSLDRAGYQRVAPLTGDILAALKAAGGRLPFHDDSTPEEIREAFGMSKKAFKQAIGSLFKQRQIIITAHGIRLASTPPVS